MPHKNNFMKSGDKITLASLEAVQMFPTLEAGTYSVNFHPDIGFYLKQIDNIVVEGKIYGDVEKRTARILNTFLDRPSTTGVLLKGEKGSGKTLLAKYVCQTAREFGIITLVVNTAFSGEIFNNFIAGINQPCIIMFDEFEKVYDGAGGGNYGQKNKQSELLTLFDGLYKTKKLFIVTCNDYNRIDGAMRNRPGRFFYSFAYKGLEDSFVREYCEDRLDNKSHIEGVVLYSKQFNRFNFDMLKAIVEEMNRYKETVMEVVKYLNTETSGEYFSYKVKALVLKEGTEALKVDEFANRGSEFDIFNERDSLFVGYNTEDSIGKKDSDGEDLRDYANFYGGHVSNITDTGEIILESPDHILTLERVIKPKKRDHEMTLLMASMPTEVSVDD